MSLKDRLNSNTKINAGGAVYVNDKGIASDTVVNSSAFMYITSGGNVKDTAVKGGVLIVTGSFYLVSELLKYS